MLVNMKEVLSKAEDGGYAVGAFNVPSLEMMRAVLEAAEELKMPLILAHAEGHNEVIPLSLIGPILVNVAKNAKIPVVVHLDHCSDFELIKQAIDIGLTSVMIDASHMEYKDNVEITKKVVDYASKYNVSVEAELGVVATSEIGVDETKETADASVENIYTDPDLAKKFVEETGIDSLAASFGTVHGIYLKEPKLDFDRLRNIHESAKIPIVMHGGSGLKDEDYINAIDNGVRKINYFSYLAKEGAEAVREYLNSNKNVFYTDINVVGKEAMKEKAKKIIKIFSRK